MSALYFAYGSNLDKNQMASRCPQATKEGKGVLADYRFIINARGVASIVEDEGSKVEGLLWAVTENDENSLDSHEGVSKGYYMKHYLTITLTDGSYRDALVYIAANNTPGKPRAGYLEKIIAAAECLKFSPTYVELLKSHHKLI